MKQNILKSSLLVLAAVMALAAKSAFADNLQDAQMRFYAADHVADRTYYNYSKCANLSYSGASTEAVVNITGLALTFHAPFGTADTSIGTSGVIDISAAAYDTMGELCDYVNTTSSYDCKLLGCKRDDNSSLLRDQTYAGGTNDMKANGGFDVLFDTGSIIGAYTNDDYESLGITPASGKRVVLKQCTANINVADSIRVYGKLRKYEGSTDGVTRNDTTQVWKSATADDTDSTVPTTYNIEPWLMFAKDEHVVIRGGTIVADGTSNQAATNFLQCLWSEE